MLAETAWVVEGFGVNSINAREIVRCMTNCSVYDQLYVVACEWIVKNEEVSRRAGIERELASRADQRVFIWFGHVERMDDYRMARRVLMAEVSGGRVRERPRLGWMDGVRWP